MADAEMLVELVDRDDEPIDGFMLEFGGVQSEDLYWPTMCHRDDGTFETSGVPTEKDGQLIVVMKKQHPSLTRKELD